MSIMNDQELEQQYKIIDVDIAKIYKTFIRNSDGRKMVSMRRINGKTLTRQYAKVLLEIKLGRLLEANETVDHIDGNKSNDDIDNLQLLSRNENAAKSAIRRLPIIANCVYCNKEFELSRFQTEKRSVTKSGPFCSRRCASSQTVKLKRQIYNVDYYRFDD